MTTEYLVALAIATIGAFFGGFAVGVIFMDEKKRSSSVKVTFGEKR
jgi:hypothetical protein